MKIPRIAALCAAVGLLGIGGVAANQYYNTGELPNLSKLISDEAAAPAATGTPLVIVNFDPAMSQRSLSDIYKSASNNIPASEAAALKAVALPTAQANPSKTVLISTYYDQEDRNNTIERAEYRALMVKNELAGIGVPDNSIVVAPAVALQNTTIPEVNKVEVRIQ